MASPMPGYSDFRERTQDALQEVGCHPREPQPLAHPELATNFTMSLAVTLLPEDLTVSGVKPEDYGVIQPCLRVHDAPQVLKDAEPWHLTFFEMAGAVVDGPDPRQRAVDVLLHLCRNLLHLGREDLQFHVFGGGGPFQQPRDDRTIETLKAIGITEDAIVLTEDCYFGKREGEKVAGPSVEVLTRSPAGEWRELATIVLLDMAIGQDGRLSPTMIPVAELGVGLERALCTLSQGPNLMVCEPIAGLAQVFSDRSGHDQFLMADRLRAACFAIAEGTAPGRKGRGSVLRGLLRELFSCVPSEGHNGVLARGVEQIALTYSDYYPGLRSPGTLEAIEQEWSHEQQRRAGKKF